MPVSPDSLQGYCIIEFIPPLISLGELNSVWHIWEPYGLSIPYGVLISIAKIDLPWLAKVKGTAWAWNHRFASTTGHLQESGNQSIYPAPRSFVLDPVSRYRRRHHPKERGLGWCNLLKNHRSAIVSIDFLYTYTITLKRLVVVDHERKKSFTLLQSLNQIVIGWYNSCWMHFRASATTSIWSVTITGFSKQRLKMTSKIFSDLRLEKLHASVPGWTASPSGPLEVYAGNY